MADIGANEEFIPKSVCTVRDCKFCGILEKRFGGIGRRTPFVGLGSGSGGLSSVVGEDRPVPIEGRRPGWEELLLLVVIKDVLDPGSDLGIDPTEVVDSAGEDERGVYGSDILALRPNIAPSLGVEFMI